MQIRGHWDLLFYSGSFSLTTGSTILVLSSYYLNHMFNNILIICCCTEWTVKDCINILLLSTQQLVGAILNTFPHCSEWRCNFSIERREDAFISASSFCSSFSSSSSSSSLFPCQEVILGNSQESTFEQHSLFNIQNANQTLGQFWTQFFCEIKIKSSYEHVIFQKNFSNEKLPWQ